MISTKDLFFGIDWVAKSMYRKEKETFDWNIMINVNGSVVPGASCLFEFESGSCSCTMRNGRDMLAEG